jgi:muconolactone delta-isomerase
MMMMEQQPNALLDTDDICALEDAASLVAEQLIPDVPPPTSAPSDEPGDCSLLLLNDTTKETSQQSAKAEARKRRKKIITSQRKTNEASLTVMEVAKEALPAILDDVSHSEAPDFLPGEYKRKHEDMAEAAESALRDLEELHKGESSLPAEDIPTENATTTAAAHSESTIDQAMDGSSDTLEAMSSARNIPPIAPTLETAATVFLNAVSSDSDNNNTKSSRNNKKKTQVRYEPAVPMDKDQLAAWRREARRVRNRESAAASRMKTKGRIQELEEQVGCWKQKYLDAMDRLREMQQHAGAPPQKDETAS